MTTITQVRYYSHRQQLYDFEKKIKHLKTKKEIDLNMR